jgi:hypothetical protein
VLFLPGARPGCRRLGPVDDPGATFRPVSNFWNPLPALPSAGIATKQRRCDLRHNLLCVLLSVRRVRRHFVSCSKCPLDPLKVCLR